MSGWDRRYVPASPAELAALEERWPSYPDAGRLFRAFVLSPTVDVCEALLAGERVPLSRLDPEWVARYGFRTVPEDGRVTLGDFNAIADLASSCRRRQQASTVPPPTFRANVSKPV